MPIQTFAEQMIPEFFRLEARITALKFVTARSNRAAGLGQREIDVDCHTIVAHTQYGVCWSLECTFSRNPKSCRKKEAQHPSF